MWDLVERHTGRVGYARPVKAEGLARDPAVIDCSGWAALLLSTAMRAWNERMSAEVFADEVFADEVFADEDIAAMDAWSDRIVAEIERRSGRPVQTRGIGPGTIPRCATIGITRDEPAWAGNHPRPRGITHIAQVVRRPRDDAALVSESLGGRTDPGVRLTPLAAWLAATDAEIAAGAVWVVDPFAMASPRARA